MTTLIITANFIALIIGIITLVLSYRLVKTYHLSYLNAYFYFVTCSVISGFFDWIVLNWIIVWVPGLVHQSANAIYHIFWDLIGFPCGLLAFYFLAVSLYDMAGLLINKKMKRFLLFIIFLLFSISLLHTIFFATVYNSFIGSFLFFVFVYILPIVQYLYLIFIYRVTVKSINSNYRFLTKFVLVIGLSFMFWYLILYSELLFHFGAFSHIIILWFYLALLIPTLLLYKWQQKTANAQTFEDIPEVKLNLVLNEFDFTEREREIILLLYKGKSNKAIEDELFISLQTVKNYVSRIYKKLNLSNRLELVNFLRNKIY